MTLIAHHPFTSTLAGADVILQAKGLNVASNSYPGGIPERIDIVDSAVRITVLETDTPTYGERRSEIIVNPQPDPTGERWYTWEFMLPSESWSDDPRGFCVMQIHESNGDPVAVQFTLHLENGQLVARVPVDVLVPGSNSYRAGSYPFVLDRWYSMCFHANWQLGNTGFWELYVDKVPMLKRFGFANAYPRELGGYLKLGIYNFNALSGWNSRVAWYRNVRIWAGNDGYNTIMGGAPLVPPRKVTL